MINKSSPRRRGEGRPVPNRPHFHPQQCPEGGHHEGPQVHSQHNLQATHEKTLQHVPLETLLKYAIDAKEAQDEMQRLDALREELKKGLAL